MQLGSARRRGGASRAMESLTRIGQQMPLRETINAECHQFFAALLARRRSSDIGALRAATARGRLETRHLCRSTEAPREKSMRSFMKRTHSRFRTIFTILFPFCPFAVFICFSAVAATSSFIKPRNSILLKRTHTRTRSARFSFIKIGIDACPLHAEKKN